MGGSNHPYSGLSKGVGTGGARGAMTPTLLKTVDFGPPLFNEPLASWLARTIRTM